MQLFTFLLKGANSKFCFFLCCTFSNQDDKDNCFGAAADADGITRGVMLTLVLACGCASVQVRVCKSGCKSCKDGITAINKDHSYMRAGGPLVQS